MFGREDWQQSHREDIIDPDREIVDPHHHLWAWNSIPPYLLDELWADTSDGHNVTKTVYIQCGWGYRKDGPENMMPVGETEFVANVAAEAARKPEKAQIAGIVSHADLRDPDLDAVLDAHEAAGQGRFRGIRHIGARDDDEALAIPGGADEGLFADPAFRKGLNRLAERGLTFEAWQYHHQLPEVVSLAKACPDATIILDHFSTPLGVGGYAGKRDEIFTKWKSDIAELATCPNVHAKLGGLAMMDNGWGYHELEKPVSSDKLVEDQGKYYHHAIEHFGPNRCMFESNFPVDRASVSYHVLWNAFKKIASNYSDAEQDAMLRGTATRVYSL